MAINWDEKILNALRSIGRYATVREIYSYLLENDFPEGTKGSTQKNTISSILTTNRNGFYVVREGLKYKEFWIAGETESEEPVVLHEDPQTYEGFTGLLLEIYHTVCNNMYGESKVFRKFLAGGLSLRETHLIHSQKPEEFGKQFIIEKILGYTDGLCWYRESVLNNKESVDYVVESPNGLSLLEAKAIGKIGTGRSQVISYLHEHPEENIRKAILTDGLIWTFFEMEDGVTREGETYDLRNAFRRFAGENVLIPSDVVRLYEELKKL